MKYWKIAFPGEHGQDVEETWREDQIIKSYFGYWYSKMCEKFGQEEVDLNYTMQDCIDDWCIVHWAYQCGGDTK